MLNRPSLSEDHKRKVTPFVLPALIVAAAATLGCGEKPAPPAPPPPPVKVATVLQKDVPIYLEAIGQTRGSTEIEVRARVGGFIQTINFAEGTAVRKGQLLYTIVDRDADAIEHVLGPQMVHKLEALLTDHTTRAVMPSSPHVIQPERT